jgi:hypothetical protein
METGIEQGFLPERNYPERQECVSPNLMDMGRKRRQCAQTTRRNKKTQKKNRKTQPTPKAT